MKKNQKKTLSAKYIVIYIGTILVAILMLIVIGVSINVSYRQSTISSIFTNLKMEETKCQLEDKNILARKETWAEGRTRSSTQSYVCGTDTKTAYSTLKKAAENAGFTYLRDEYPGSADPEPHFKNDKGQYLIVDISSKPRDDAIRNAYIMGTDDTKAVNMNFNSGPANVIIHVNIDDDNL